MLARGAYAGPVSEYHKPALPGPGLFEAQIADDDPALRSEAGARVATLLVRGTNGSDDSALVERVVGLADEHGLDLVAQLWAHFPASTLPGALWRLYVLRSWVLREPRRAAREFEAGKRFAPVDEVVAGVVDPPGPEEVAHLVDCVVRGIVTSDLSDVLDRAAAFARLVGVGRANLREDPPKSTTSAARLVETAEALQEAAHQERSGALR